MLIHNALHICEPSISQYCHTQTNFLFNKQSLYPYSWKIENAMLQGNVIQERYAQAIDRPLQDHPFNSAQVNMQY